MAIRHERPFMMTIYRRAARPRRPAPTIPGIAVAIGPAPPLLAAVALEAAELTLLAADAALLEALEIAAVSLSEGTAEEIDESADDRLELTSDSADEALEEADEAASVREDEIEGRISLAAPEKLLAPPETTEDMLASTCAYAMPARARRATLAYMAVVFGF